MSVGWPQALEDRYTLLRPLSDGVIARVYAARDVKHARDVAVKILRVEHGDANLVARFLKEVQILARLNHPHILPLFDSGEVDGAPYFVMPLVEGNTLRRRLDDEGPLALPVALSIARQIAAALEYAHQHGILHRDIKPENVLLEGREVRVTDFGIAAVLGARLDDRITQVGMVLGTPRYMSPEQAAGEPELTAASDIYSLGLLLFEMLTGELPYPPIFSAAAAAAVAAGVPSVRAHRDDVPAELDAALQRALAWDPQQRTASARAFIEALAGFGGERDVRADSARGPARPPAHVAVRGRRRWMAAVVIVVALIAIVASPLWRADTEPTPRRWILVADFDAEPADRANAVAMRELALTELAQSSDFSIVPSEHVTTARRNAGIADSLPMSGVIARELATRSTVPVVVEGGIRRLGAGSWTLTMRAVNADDGSVLYAASAEASDAVLVREVGSLVRRVRAGLGERAEALNVTRPLQEVSTASFPAFLLYQNAIARARSADYDGALHLAHQATALDSGFASAWALMANVFVSLQQVDSAAWAFDRARALPQRLGDAERDRLDGDIAFFLEHDAEAALRAYDRYLVRRPESLAGHNNRALFLSALGRHAEALAGFRDAMNVDPLQVGPRNIQLLNIATELVVIGELDSARVAAHRLQAAHAQYVAMLLLNAEGRWDSLRAVARAVLDAAAPARFAAFPALLHEVGSFEALGRREEADSALAAAMAGAEGSDLRWLSHARLLLDAARDERPRWSLPQSITVQAGGPACVLRGVHAALRAAEAEAREALRCLRELSPREQRALGSGPQYIEALLAFEANDAARAYALVRDAARRGEHHPFSVDRVGSIALRLLEARALASLGRHEEAAQALARAKQARGIAPNHFPLRGMAARAVVRASRTAAASGQ